MKTKITYTLECPYQHLRKDEYYNLLNQLDVLEQVNIKLKNGFKTVTIGKYNNHFMEIQMAVRNYE